MSGWSESPPRHWLWSNGGASVEGTEIYGFVGGAWHGLPPLWCHVTPCHPIGLGAVNERRAQWAGALSLPSKGHDCFLFPASSRTPQERCGAHFFAPVRSRSARPWPDNPLEEIMWDISVAAAAARWGLAVFWTQLTLKLTLLFSEFWSKRKYVCLSVSGGANPLNSWRHGCHSTPTHHNESQRGPSERLSARAWQPAPRPWGSREGSSTRLRSTLV